MPLNETPPHENFLRTPLILTTLILFIFHVPNATVLL